MFSCVGNRGSELSLPSQDQSVSAGSHFCLNEAQAGAQGNCRASNVSSRGIYESCTQEPCKSLMLVPLS